MENLTNNEITIEQDGKVSVKNEIKINSKQTKKNKIDSLKETKNQANESQNTNKDDNEERSNPIYKIWDIHEPFTIPGTTFTIKGFSIAALRTNFYIKELNIMLDAGLASPTVSIEHLFITHGHSDHTANLPYHIYSKKENQTIQIYTPKESTDYARSFIESAYIISSDCDVKALGIKNEDLYIHKYYNLNSVTPGDTFNISIKSKNFVVEIIKCYHSIPCVGYGLSEIRQKLKDEYKNLNGKEIGELRKKGENIYYEQKLPFFLFLGDTSKEILKEEALDKYKTIMIECTFIFDDDLDQADKTCHLHWKYLDEYIKKNSDKTFILYHFSQRYTKKELTDFFDKIGYNNVVPWIN